ncbi:hypothetical protein ABK040_007321 [Willaertia magna]
MLHLNSLTATDTFLTNSTNYFVNTNPLTTTTNQTQQQDFNNNFVEDLIEDLLLDNEEEEEQLIDQFIVSNNNTSGSNNNSYNTNNNMITRAVVQQQHHTTGLGLAIHSPTSYTNLLLRNLFHNNNNFFNNFQTKSFHTNLNTNLNKKYITHHNSKGKLKQQQMNPTSTNTIQQQTNNNNHHSSGINPINNNNNTNVEDTTPQYLKAINLPSFININKQVIGYGLGKRYSIPENDNEYKELCGEDSFFTFENEFMICAGVADGVGGWSELGVDPSLISNYLMYNAKRICEEMECCNSSSNDNNISINNRYLTPKEILKNAYQRIIENKQVLAGSTTACIVHVDKYSKLLKCCNLGDSGCSIYRKIKKNDNNSIDNNNETYECVFQSEELQHYFNCPYQLGIVPTEMMDTTYHDIPEDGIEEDFQLKENDIIIIATDGVWDNLFHSDIIEILNHHYSNSNNTIDNNNNTGLNSKEIAKEITIKARLKGEDENANTPFAEQSNHRFIGGKLDDVTTVCFIV